MESLKHITPFGEIESHRSYLVRYARVQLRDNDAAEEVVQEALLAALEGVAHFSGQSSMRTWLTSILRFKIIDLHRAQTSDQLRFVRPNDDEENEASEYAWLDNLFDESGHWRNPVSAWNNPHGALEEKQFFAVFERCMDKLPAPISRVFFKREVLGDDTENICKEESIAASNCWVMLHRARISLRECLDRNWFRKD